MAPRKSALLTPSLASTRPVGSGESALELRKVRVDRPGVAHGTHDRAEERVVDLAALGDREHRRVVPLGRELERPRPAVGLLTDDPRDEQPRRILLDGFGLDVTT